MFSNNSTRMLNATNNSNSDYLFFDNLIKLFDLGFTNLQWKLIIIALIGFFMIIWLVILFKCRLVYCARNVPIQNIQINDLILNRKRLFGCTTCVLNKKIVDIRKLNGNNRQLNNNNKANNYKFSKSKYAADISICLFKSSKLINYDSNKYRQKTKQQQQQQQTIIFTQKQICMSNNNNINSKMNCLLTNAKLSSNDVETRFNNNNNNLKNELNKTQIVKNTSNNNIASINTNIITKPLNGNEIMNNSNNTEDQYQLRKANYIQNKQQQQQTRRTKKNSITKTTTTTTNNNEICLNQNYDNRQQQELEKNLLQNGIIDFTTRINRLRFIDDSASATSTAVTSPVENKINPFLLLNQQNSIDTNNRNYKFIKALRNQSKLNITSSSTSITSSTETLCSDDDKNKKKTKDVKQQNKLCFNRPQSSDFENENEEIKNITSTKQGQFVYFKPSSVKAVVNHNHKYNRYRHQREPPCTSSFTDTDSTTDQEFNRKQYKLINKKILSHKNHVKGKTLIQRDHLKNNEENLDSGLDEKYFIKQTPDVPTNNINNVHNNEHDILNFDENDGTINEEEDEEDDDDKCFTSILVEDGFIRMSSPVDTDDDTRSNEFNYCEYCKLNLKTNNNNNNTSNTNGAIAINKFTSCSCYLKNFPNVGSSPVTEESELCFDNFDSKNQIGQFDELLDDSDNEDDEDKMENEEEQEDEEEEEQEEEGEDNEEPDEVIVHNSLDDTKVDYIQEKQITTDKKPQPIIKKSSLITSTFVSMISANNVVDESLITHQNTLTNEKIGGQIRLNTESNSSNYSISSINNTTVTKPKVRFNLDANYEKEREWNRINKILGDASKSHIEWTDEVEV